jgi:hypothetical protein
MEKKREKKRVTLKDLAHEMATMRPTMPPNVMALDMLVR